MTPDAEGPGHNPAGYELSADTRRGDDVEWEHLLEGGQWGTPCAARPAERFETAADAEAAWTRSLHRLPPHRRWEGTIWRAATTGPPVRELRHAARNGSAG